MIHWKEEQVVSAPIEKVWTLFFEENMQKIMPKVVENVWVTRKEGVAGSTYHQKYREGRREETYLVEITEYEDSPERKHKRITFTIALAFEVDLSFTLTRIDDNQTRFVYEGTNRGKNFVGRAMLKLGGQSNNHTVVQDFMQKVKQESSKL